jgi:hypothetical protein
VVENNNAAIAYLSKVLVIGVSGVKELDEQEGEGKENNLVEPEDEHGALNGEVAQAAKVGIRYKSGDSFLKKNTISACGLQSKTSKAKTSLASSKPENIESIIMGSVYELVLIIQQ